MPLCEKTLKMAHRKLTVVVHRSHSILFMPLSSDYTLLSAPKHFSTQTWSAINFTVVQNKSSAHFCIILIMQFLFFVICSKYCNNPSSRLSREIPFSSYGGRTDADGRRKSSWRSFTQLASVLELERFQLQKNCDYNYLGNFCTISSNRILFIKVIDTSRIDY